jgi:hypothetical protein
MVQDVFASGARLVRSRCSGQASIELALVMLAALVPLTLGVVGIAEVAWTYHAVVTLTRQGAHYASTHCWEDDGGSNVTAWMQANAPAPLNLNGFRIGAGQIQVQYWTNNTSAQSSVPFDSSACAAACSPQCVPDSVTVGITGYQFQFPVPLFGLSQIQVPAFATTIEMQSAGGDPETGVGSP